MKLVALMACRNEEWVLGLSARVALTWCDSLVIGLHACTDRSDQIVAEIQREYPGRVATVNNEDQKWDEMKHRQDMLTVARHIGATHIAMTDADEILTGNLLRQAEEYGPAFGTHLSQLPLYNLRGGISRYHANGLWGNRIVSVAFKDDPALHWGGDTFHQREPRGKRLAGFQRVQQGDGGVMHLWGASERRLLAKHALYKATERLRWPEKDIRQIDFQYSQCVKGGLRDNPKDWTYVPVPLNWWEPYRQWMKYIDVDAEPWQEAEVRRLVAEHGHEKFMGLDLFGVA